MPLGLSLPRDDNSTWAAKMIDRSHRHRIDDGVVDEIVAENVEMIDCRTFFSVPEQRRTDQSRKKCLENKSNECFAPNNFFQTMVDFAGMIFSKFRQTNRDL